MNKVPLKIALVGCGYWGRNLARNINANEKMSLAAVCDLDTNTLNEFELIYPETLKFELIEELLSSDIIDAVVLATPSGLDLPFSGPRVSHYTVRNSLET